MPNSTTNDSFSTPFDVPPGYNGKTQFSPEIDPHFIGIKLSAPALVSVPLRAAPSNRESGFVYVPISMRYQFTGAYAWKFNYIDEHMAVVAVNGRTGESYTSTLKYEDRAPIDPDEHRIPFEEAEKYLEGGYLTFDLTQFLPLPEKEAVYHVHVTLEQYQSNIIKIELKRKAN